MSDAAKIVDMLTTGMSVLRNYFDNLIKLLFWSVSS